MSQLESRIQTNCINWYKRTYPTNYIKKNEQVVKSGDPDIFICHFGVFVAIEMKQVGKSPTKLQTLKLEQIKQADGVVGVAHSLEEFKNIIKETERYSVGLIYNSPLYEEIGGTCND